MYEIVKVILKKNIRNIILAFNHIFQTKITLVGPLFNVP